ncbi:hypothetical protein EXIGLDRAFT_217897 [Exidia glandulosa HHB12029]|uniref:Uncharacterized protein n=1 Tax=Exidia glandulosa HHB12029 TaxID=1314781 RepID=A0A165EEH5_EXIGL|nr:hypothetical protein EXIGLDRAFT_217897 [Exidia glandulosa HHB12029]
MEPKRVEDEPPPLGASWEEPYGEERVVGDGIQYPISRYRTQPIEIEDEGRIIGRWLCLGGQEHGLEVHGWVHFLKDVQLPVRSREVADMDEFCEYRSPILVRVIVHKSACKDEVTCEGQRPVYQLSELHKAISIVVSKDQRVEVDRFDRAIARSQRLLTRRKRPTQRLLVASSLLAACSAMRRTSSMGSAQNTAGIEVIWTWTRNAAFAAYCPW